MLQHDRGNRRTLRTVVASAALAGSGLLFSAQVSAISIPVGDLTTIQIENLFTAGGAIRTQRRDDSLISKSSLNPGICLERVAGEFDGADRAYMGDTCNAGVDDPDFGDANNRFVNEPGSFGPNADNGNMNFDRGDFVNLAAKVTTDISFSIPVRGTDVNFFARTLMLFDERYINLQSDNFDTTLQPARSRIPSGVTTRIGANSQILDAHVSANIPMFGDRNASLRVGRQVLNWGESAFLVSNSLNFINPPSQALLRVPGFDIAELLRPQGMVVLDTDVVQDLSLELFYQYEWRPVVADPVGSFFSSSDIVGDGGTYAMLAFGKAPEDPLGLYEPIRNPEDPAAVTGSTSSRTIFRDFDEERARRPSNGGQYGAALKYFMPRINNGLEVGLYFSNYHSRFPVVSAFASDETCIGSGDGASAGTLTTVGGLVDQLGLPLAGAVPNIASLIDDCGIPVANLGAAVGMGEFQAAEREALPLDTARLFVEYPEDIRLYGISFNTALGAWAFSGEYAFRDRLPTQIHATDLVFAALQPAFPEENFDVGIGVLPGRRQAVPDFISLFRGEDIEANQYVRGYENLKTGQVNLNFIRFLGGSENPFRASQMILVLEVGINHVIDMPNLDELQFNGGQADTHISNGADGTQGIQPADVADQPTGEPGDDEFQRRGRQNPTTLMDRRALGTDLSYGYRAVALTRYDNAIFGSNLTLLTAMFHDVKGTTPGIGGNFIEGRRMMIAGAALDYLNSLQFSVRYTWFTGGGKRDPQRDRDNLQFFVGYQF